MSTTEVNFEITETSQGVTPVLHVHGYLDVSTSPILERRLFTRADVEDPFVALDLAEVSFVDSTALNVFLVATKHFRDRGGDLHLVVTPSIQKLLEVTALDRVLTIYPSVTEAVEAAHRG